jgi:hypothetical protein
MKSVIRKAYFNYENEEKWLNEMAAKGLALKDYSWCRYVFANSQPGEYVYRLELLENLPSHPESMNYIRFMEENGIECVAFFMRWVYFRKKASDGGFDIYSDIDSKIKHYRRVNTFFTIIALANVITGAVNLALPLGHIMQGQAHDVYTMNFWVGGLNAVVFTFLLVISHPMRKKIKKLKQEKSIME